MLSFICFFLNTPARFLKMPTNFFPLFPFTSLPFIPGSAPKQMFPYTPRIIDFLPEEFISPPKLWKFSARTLSSGFSRRPNLPPFYRFSASSAPPGIFRRSSLDVCSCYSLTPSAPSVDHNTKQCREVIYTCITSPGVYDFS